MYSGENEFWREVGKAGRNLGERLADIIERYKAAERSMLSPRMPEGITGGYIFPPGVLGKDGLHIGIDPAKGKDETAFTFVRMGASIPVDFSKLACGHNTELSPEAAESLAQQAKEMYLRESHPLHEHIANTLRNQPKSIFTVTPDGSNRLHSTADAMYWAANLQGDICRSFNVPFESLAPLAGLRNCEDYDRAMRDDISRACGIPPEFMGGRPPAILFNHSKHAKPLTPPEIENIYRRAGESVRAFGDTAVSTLRDMERRHREEHERYVKDEWPLLCRALGRDPATCTPPRYESLAERDAHLEACRRVRDRESMQLFRRICGLRNPAVLTWRRDVGLTSILPKGWRCP